MSYNKPNKLKCQSTKAELKPYMLKKYISVVLGCTVLTPDRRRDGKSQMKPGLEGFRLEFHLVSGHWPFVILQYILSAGNLLFGWVWVWFFFPQRHHIFPWLFPWVLVFSPTLMRSALRVSQLVASINFSMDPPAACIGSHCCFPSPCCFLSLLLYFGDH